MCLCSRPLNLRSTVLPHSHRFGGGFTDGTYAYFSPYYNAAGNSGIYGKVARVALNDFTASGVTTLDLAAIDTELKGCTAPDATVLHPRPTSRARSSGAHRVRLKPHIPAANA